MSDYHLVSTLHAARVTLADVRKAGLVTRRRAAAVAAAEADVAAARAAVDAALDDGRVVSSKHLLDLDFDCLGAILSYLGPHDAPSAGRTCTTLHSALFHGGLPGPLAGVCRTWPRLSAAETDAAIRALDEMEPALGALRLHFIFNDFGEGHARLLARALDKAPRAARIDIKLEGWRVGESAAGRLADVLTWPDRAFAAPPQVHLEETREFNALLRLTRAGVCVVSAVVPVGQNISQIAANTLTELYLGSIIGPVNLTTRFPALRRLRQEILSTPSFTTDMPSLTALAPHLKEIEILARDADDPPRQGFGFDPGRFARFVVAIQGVTRVCFVYGLIVTLSQNENENLRHLTALRTLRDLKISTSSTYVALVPQPSRPDPLRPPVPEDVITNLPPLPPGLTRLTLSGSARAAFGHPLPELRVLDWRGSYSSFSGATFNPDDRRRQTFARRGVIVPFTIPSAAVAPNLHTLLIGYFSWDSLRLEYLNEFDLWTLVAARTGLRVVVIERARLLCSAPAGFDTTTAGFTALLARVAKDLVSFHMHDCLIKGGHEPAVENFFRALEARGVRVCRTGIKDCLFCMLHDGTDLWPDFF